MNYYEMSDTGQIVFKTKVDFVVTRHYAIMAISEYLQLQIENEAKSPDEIDTSIKRLKYEIARYLKYWGTWAADMRSEDDFHGNNSRLAEIYEMAIDIVDRTFPRLG